MLGAVVLLALGLAGACVTWLLPRHVGENTVSFALESLEEGQPQFYRAFNMGHDEGGRPYAMYLLRTGRGTEVLALFSRDPHALECSVALVERSEADGGELGFESPCSGSLFDIDGSRADGPAPRDLDAFAVTVQGITVQVDVTELILGRCASAAPSDSCSSGTVPRTQTIDWPGN